MPRIINLIIGIVVIIALASFGLFVLKIAIGLITTFIFAMGVIVGYYFRALTHYCKK